MTAAARDPGFELASFPGARLGGRGLGGCAGLDRATP